MRYYAVTHCVDLERHLKEKQMGRPLHKKFFGNRNIGSTSTTADDGIGGQGVASVTISGVWADFTQATSTVTFSAPQLPGGVTATGTVTITAGAPVSVTITEQGSGYTSAPTVTIADSDAGAETIGTATAVLTVDTGAPGSATNQENAITITGRIVAGSTVALDIIKQTGARRYLVTDGTNTGVVELVGDAVDAAGEANIVATDSAGGTYYVTKITAHRALVVPGTGTQFPLVNGSAQSIPWVLDTAVLNTSVRIANA
jgi:hypothetical protein